VTLAGHRGDAEAARAGLADPAPEVRAAALGALERAGALTIGDLAAGLADPTADVRRRACEVAPRADLATADSGPLVLARLDDPEPVVVEVAAWALGELGDRGALPSTAVSALARVATDHEDPLAREAAVAALGALGDPAGLPAILAATTDKPAIRRRAVLALSPFEGPEIVAALARALEDRDWQVRDAAALLTRTAPG